MKCKCGCNTEIPTKPWHKYYRHDFLKGHRPKRKQSNGVCENCGKKIFYFTPPSHRSTKKHFCSRDCYLSYDAPENKETCPECGIVFAWKGRVRNQKFCSNACYKKHRGFGKGCIEILHSGYQCQTIKINGKKYRTLIHRKIIESIIGRKLLKTEIVHHINGNKLDNRMSNLMLLSCKKAHNNIHSETPVVNPKHILFDGSKAELGK